MRILTRSVLGVCLALGILLCIGFALAASHHPRVDEPTDVFGFSRVGAERGTPTLPALQTFSATDGARLSYRLYDSPANRIVVFIHGSSYHGAAYHALAERLSSAGVAKVVTPNLRGHYMSERRRGDVEYVGQLEDDLHDLVEVLRSEGHREPITLGGHSSGGGFVIRFAGGVHREDVDSYLLLSPMIPTSDSAKGGNAGGWANFHRRRLFGLLILNAFGIHGFDGLTIIEFNKPRVYWDGTETLAYSYRMNQSYHPRFDFQADIDAVRTKPWLLLVGSDDEAIDAVVLKAMFDSEAAQPSSHVLPGVNHFGVFSDPAALERVSDWLGGLSR